MVVYDSLTDEEMDTYAQLKEVLLQQFYPNTDEERLVPCNELSWRFKEDQESTDKLAWDIQKFLEKASSILPDVLKITKLHSHLTNAILERVSFQFKLLPKGKYHKIKAKAKELFLKNFYLQLVLPVIY